MAISTLGSAGLETASAAGTGAVALPAGTTAERPASPVTGQFRYNTTTNAPEYWNGSAWSGFGLSPLTATGGTITTYVSGSTTYKVHTFTSSGTFTVSATGAAPTVSYLVVAGGASGGFTSGGGAGGMLTGTATVTATAYTITVGAGGAANVTSQPSTGLNGSNSVFGAFATATGGGAGGGGWTGGGNATGPSSGGSGGGGGAKYTPGGGSGTTGGASGTAGQGNSGGSAAPATDQISQLCGGAGGGAGASGGNANSSLPGAGGAEVWLWPDGRHHHRRSVALGIQR